MGITSPPTTWSWLRLKAGMTGTPLTDAILELSRACCGETAGVPGRVDAGVAVGI